MLHPDADGVDQPVSSLWKKPPVFIEAVFARLRLFEVGAVQNLSRAALRQRQPEIDLSLREGQDARP